jgi:hypothetical protein
MSTKSMEELEKEVAELRAIVNEGKKKFIGWLITTQNVAYEGSTYDLKFKNGYAFAIESEIYPRFVNDLDTRTMKAWRADPEKHPDIEREIAEHHAMAELNSSKIMVKNLVSDFGYSSEYFGPGQSEEDRLTARLAELDQAANAEIELRKSKENPLNSILGRDNWLS